MQERLPVPADLPLCFVLPEGSELVSGGNLYNRAFLEALAALVPVRRLSLGEWRRELQAGTPGCFFLDSLDLNQAPELARRRPGQYFGLLVHHLPSLEPGLPESHPSRRFEAEALTRFDLFVCTSPFTREYLGSRGIPEARLLTVPPAPPAARARARRYEPPLSALMVANLIPRKGVLELLRALSARGEALEFRLTIVGRDDIDPDYASACRAFLAGSPYLAPRARIAPAVSQERMLEYYEVNDLVVSAAKMETFGMALQEARAHGLPLLVQAGGFARAHVDEGSNGLVLGDVTALADALLSLAREALRMSALFAGAQATRPGTGYGWRDAARRFLVGLGR
ncbi:MAG TPA: glycosyltransferase family 4 protein [Polyangiaceae bacterium]